MSSLQRITSITFAVVVILSILLMALAQVACALEQPRIIGFYSDFTTADITIRSPERVNATLRVDLLFREAPERAEMSETLNMELESGDNYRVLLWDEKPRFDYYTARARLFLHGRLVDEAEYSFSYGTAALPWFHIVDFTPNSREIYLLLRPLRPAVADIIIEVLEGAEVVYSENETDIPITATRELRVPWPFLLENHREYTVRLKVLTHRVGAPPLENTYVSVFTATDDVEIIPDDVDVDEVGASVTLRGLSQVPFEGYVNITLVKDDGRVYRFSEVTEILLNRQEDTVGVVWDLPPGVYTALIEVVNSGGEVKDSYESAFRVPETPVVTATPTPGTPGFTVLSMLAGGVLLLIVRLCWRRG